MTVAATTHNVYIELHTVEHIQNVYAYDHCNCHSKSNRKLFSNAIKMSKL